MEFDGATTTDQLSFALIQLSRTARSLPTRTKDVTAWIDFVGNQVQIALEESSRDAIPSVSILKVLDQLLQHHVLSDDLRTNLIELFCAAFFDPEGSDEAACSESGRFAVSLACKLFKQCNYSIREAKNHFGSAVSDILDTLPRHLVSWKSNHSKEIDIGLDLMQSVVRRIGIVNVGAVASEGMMLAQWRSALEPLCSGDSSSLELYPVALQR